MPDFAGVPEDLIALELERRSLKADADSDPRACRYALDCCTRDIAAHPWLVERKTDWRAARKVLKAAADRYAALWDGVTVMPDATNAI